LRRPNPSDFYITDEQIRQYHLKYEQSDKIFKKLTFGSAILCALLVFIYFVLKGSLLEAFLFSPVGAIWAFLPGLFIASYIRSIYIKCIENTENIERYLGYEKEYEEYQLRTNKENYWLSLNGKEFEIEVAQLFKNLGYYDVELTPTAGDSETYLYMSFNDDTYIAKCNVYKKPIGVSVARDLLRTMMIQKINKALLISVSGFERDVFEIAKDKNIDLLDLDFLVSRSLDTYRLVI